MNALQRMMQHKAKQIEDALFREKLDAITGATANTVASNQEPFTIDKMMKAIDEIRIPPDPLEGADLLIAGGTEGIKEARKIADAKGGNGSFFHGIQVRFNPAIPEDQIWCMKDNKVVKILRVSDENNKKNAE